MGIGGIGIWQLLILLFLFIPVWFGIYFLPAIMAFHRNHHNKLAILVLNLFLGWTFLGWVGALIWSFMQVQES